MKRIRVARNIEPTTKEDEPTQKQEASTNYKYYSVPRMTEAILPTRFPPRYFAQSNVEVEVESGTIKVKPVSKIEPTIAPNPKLNKSATPTKSTKHKSKAKRPVKTPETDALADDDYFFKQVRREKELKDHSFKSDVELFDVARRKVPKPVEYHDSTYVKHEQNDKMNSETDGEKNYEFIQNPKNLGKNDKIAQKVKIPKCFECDSTVTGEQKENLEQDDDQKVKIINDFSTRILKQQHSAQG